MYSKMFTSCDALYTQRAQTSKVEMNASAAFRGRDRDDETTRVPSSKILIADMTDAEEKSLTFVIRSPARMWSSSYHIHDFWGKWSTMHNKREHTLGTIRVLMRL